ncbi:glutaredoxin family protein [Hydrogenophaga sp. PAMC20947]|uniref:glutaredoxin family protein n=1 Tax=Hydrogenophaga sp. PAMC20947 TaxID=2565558 RepID=UPI00109DC7FD|nr:glutaredoxin family protein [Hydrogenophaga sp. PAMC20947]QCB45674.1 glutaredoxin family protein [Hydrogenophaga sp. PAMC20947]
MNSHLTAPLTVTKSVWIVLATVCAVGLASGQAGAQGVYRIVGSDGRVTYSDQPPANNADAAPVGSATANTAASANAQLPLALRQIVNRYPVVLYTGKDCSPCSSGRNLLANRGIPFSEKTVSSAEDIEAFKRLSGDLSLPLLSIGSQRLKGFSDGEWTQYLDAAGYAQQSSLPPNYSRPSATPLVEVKAATPAPKETAKSTRREISPETPVVPTTVNPAGIRF